MSLRDRLQSSLGGTYTLERELGGGGMARVFVGEETALGRRVVVKVLPDELSGAVNVDRFRREVQIAARLQHPCIVSVLQAGVADGTPFYTMPFVDGRSLRDRLAAEGELTVPEAVKILRDMASALAYAHEHGVVHRDIKPDNVLLSDGYALVTDFGIARALSDSTDGAERLTATGIAMGTPAYMSPEQASGDPGIDHRADLYAFGCVAYETLIGQPPFAARTMRDAAAAHLLETPRSVASQRPAVPAALSSLVARCLEKRPADRPQSAREILHELEALTTPAAGTQSGAPSGGPARRRMLGAIVAVTAAVAAASAAVFASGRRSAAAPSNASARRIVIRTFANNTGDKSLDPLGLMAADWIARGLTETGGVEVAGTESEIAARNGGSSAQAPSTTVGLGRLMRAKYVVSGSYYLQRDSVMLQAEVSDADAGRRLLTVAPAGAPLADRQSALERLRQHVAGALIPFFDSSLVETTSGRVPPKYDAYREFLFGEQSAFVNPTEALSHYRAAIRLDSTFVPPRLRVIDLFARAGSRAPMQRDSVIADLQTRQAVLSPYERAALNMRDGINHNDFDKAYEAQREAARLQPRSPYVQYELAEVAQLGGRVAESLRLLESLDPDAGAMRNHSPYYTDLCRAYHHLGRQRDLRRCLEQALKRYPGQLATLTRALGALGDTRAVEAYFDSTLTPNARRAPLTASLFELDAHGHAAEARSIALAALPRANRPLTDSVAAAGMVSVRFSLLALLDRWEEAKTLADSMVAVHPNAWLAVGAQGIAHAKLGDTVAARRAEQDVAHLSVPRASEVQLRMRAMVLAAMGDRSGAVALLRAGTSAAWEWQFHDDLLYRLLRGYGPFEDLLKPRG